MPPSAKRKRGDARAYSQDDDSNPRPSPHRPQNLPLAHAQQANTPRGGRRGGRSGGRGASSTPHSPNVTHASPTAMSPPVHHFQSNKAAQTTPSTPASQPQDPSSSQTEPPEIPESNDYLTPDRVANWNADARKAVVETAQTAQRDGDLMTLGVVFHEIIEAAIYKLMSKEELGSMVRDIVTAPADEMVDPSSMFLDMLSTLTTNEDTHKEIRQMLLATDIDAAKMRSELESSLLTSLELVRPTFPRVAIRKATHALYRQSNYNLLREETEGYSKLITEYFTTVNNEPPSQEVVSDTYERVNALIGAFDLDVGRVLDVTLDVFANLLVKHGRFFVKFLRSSAWWPEPRGLDGIEWEQPEVSTLPKWATLNSPLWYYSDEEKEEQLRLREQRDHKFWRHVAELGERKGISAFFELGSRRITGGFKPTEQLIDSDNAELSSQQKAQKWTDEWMAQTGTLPPSGNDIAAQLLGFKLRFYASDARDASDMLPDNLIYLAALLIKIGFISILDLYPHLYPLDEDMVAHRDKLMKAKKEKEDKLKGKSTNALAMAGALPDDTPSAPAITRLKEAESKPSSKPESERSTPSKSDEGGGPKLPEPVDQKVALLRSLLCIGAIPEALFIIGRFPWLLEVYPDLPTYIFRLAHHSLSKVYDSARPIPPRQIPSIAKGASNSNLPRTSDFVHRRTLRWAKLEEKDAGEGIDYRFYWEDWVDNVPVCQDVDDVIRLCTSLLGLIGPECGRDIVLLTKLARIAKKSLADDTSKENLKRWIDFSTTFLAPALSYTGQNPGVVNEIWDLFKQFDTATRYAIYSQWFNPSKPAMRAFFKDVESSTKSLLGKIATTNTREMGREMAKLAYACPGIVFRQTLRQGQSYVNMIDTLVECSRYLTLLGYDCLTWTLVDTFVSNAREARQDDGMLTKPWLKNTATFIGKVYRRYSLMDPTPVLQYITRQLVRPNGDLYILAVLEQLTSSMAGIGLGGALTEARVLALSAGPSLRAFTQEHHLADSRHETKSSVRRLLRCLKEPGLAPQILIALAQQLEFYVHREEVEDAPAKVIATNLDGLRSTFAQYLDLLRSNLSVNEFDDIIPDVVELVSDFSVEPSIAFTISRASITHVINGFRAEKKQQHDSVVNKNVSGDGDVAMGGVEGTLAVNGKATPESAKQTPPPTDIEMKDHPSTSDVDMKEVTESGQSNGLNGTNHYSSPPPSNPAITALAKQLKIAAPDEFGDNPCLIFFITFWQLSLIDIYTPDSKEIGQLYKDATSFLNNKANHSASDRRFFNQDLASRMRNESTKLAQEEREVSQSAQLVQAHLREEMHGWFEGLSMAGDHSDTFHKALLQKCFLPRSYMSLQDAQFASAMLKFMHKSGVPGFRTIKLIDVLVTTEKITNIIATTTEEESKNFGRFLSDILRELQSWHVSKDQYTKSAYGEDKRLPGFGRKFNSDRVPTEFLSYDDFCLLLCKWHNKLFTAIKGCLDSGEYMEIRNSINILKALSPTFPKVDWMARDLRQPVNHLAQNDQRDDVKTAANSILYEFKRNEKSWKTEGQFKNIPTPSNANSTTGRTSSESKTPQPADKSTAKLNASAPSFKPKPMEINGTPNPLAENKTSDPAPHTVLPPIESTSRSKVAEAPKSTPAPPLTQPKNAIQSHDKGNVKPATGPSAPSAQPTFTPLASRSENRSVPAPPTAAGRPPHALPSRPDAQPARIRQPDRPMERQSEYNPHGRHENRANPSNEYGRPDRSNDPHREREASPGRRPRARTPDRVSNAADRREWPERDPRDYDDRPMRAPPRDARGPPGRGPAWESRDSRDLRGRVDPRGTPHPPSLDGRSRLHSNPIVPTEDSHHRREPPLTSHQGGDRSGPLPPRPTPHTTPANDRSMINPERAALINDERGRNEGPRPDRDGRRERGSRPQSPRREERRGDRRPEERRLDDRRSDERRGEERTPTSYHSRNESRDHRDDRGPPQVYPSGRDRREEPTGLAPTGPRGSRNEPSHSSRVSREMFTPSQPSRQGAHQSQDPNYGRLNAPVAHQAQDPNYGRLNPPSDNIPSGPRSLTNDRRESQGHAPASIPPTAPAAVQPSGIHPSRLTNFRAPALQTDVPGAPSGPRSSTRSSQGLLPSPSSRGPPTGPARNSSTALRAINNVLTQSAPPDKPRDTGRRSERRERSRSPERREKRVSERESREGRRERDRDRDREKEREKEREPRDNRRTSGRDDGRDGRKRGRDVADQPHGELKRSRR